MLEEIEQLYAYNVEYLENADMTVEEIEEIKNEYDSFLSMPEYELEDKYAISKIQIKAMKMAREKGEAKNNLGEKYCRKPIENQVEASGSLTSSEISFTQSVISNREKTPNYTVNLSFAWEKPYVTRWFEDKIVVAWGGGLTTNSATGVARYSDWKSVDGGWLKYDHSKKMTADESGSIDAGIIFSFPQSDGESTNGSPEAKHGSASVNIYQTKKEGKDTIVISYFAHRRIAIVGGGIDIKATPSISFGTAWDTSKKCSAKITY